MSRTRWALAEFAADPLSWTQLQPWRPSHQLSAGHSVLKLAPAACATAQQKSTTTSTRARCSRQLWQKALSAACCYQ